MLETWLGSLFYLVIVAVPVMFGRARLAKRIEEEMERARREGAGPRTEYYRHVAEVWFPRRQF